MISLQYRSNNKELLDGDNIPFPDIKRNMEELNTINTLLGGHSITVKGFATLAEDREKITVCEIGCGGGDNLVAIANWCRKNRIELRCIGIDIKQECIDVAKELPQLKEKGEWVIADYSGVVFSEKPDIIFSSLFCHHFTNEELIKQLQWMRENANIGFFINDLHRNQIAYYSIRILSFLFSSSYLVKNDAPLSVARGFRKKEWIQIFEKAEVKPIKIAWEWAFRYLIVYRHES